MTQGNARALWQPGGMSGRGGGGGQDRGHHVYLWLIHADAWQKESQYCKVPKVAPALTMTKQNNTSRKVNNYCYSLIYYILIVMSIKSSLLVIFHMSMLLPVFFSFSVLKDVNKRNANQNHNEVPLHASQDGCYPKVYKQ